MFVLGIWVKLLTLRGLGRHVALAFQLPLIYLCQTTIVFCFCQVNLLHSKPGRNQVLRSNLILQTRWPTILSLRTGVDSQDP